MPSQTTAVLVAVLTISLISVIGAALLLGRAWVKRFLPLLVAVAAGALLGDTFLHLLPHAVADQGGFTPTIAYGVLAGLVGFFIIEGVLHWHHHGEDVHDHGPEGIHSFGWMNIIGDGFHNFIDGMLIAAAFLHSHEVGVATTIAVALHEIPQEFGDFSILLHAGFTPKKAIFFNLLSALAAVLGAGLVLTLGGDNGLSQFLVPFAAGGFLYIACADLVPEIRKRARGAALIPVVFALAFGLGLMVAVHAVAHGDHDHAHGGHGHGHGHAHDGGDHEGHDHGSDGDDHEGHDHGGEGPGKKKAPAKDPKKDDGHGHSHDDGHDHDGDEAVPPKKK